MMYQIVLIDRLKKRYNMKKLTAAFGVLMQSPDDSIIRIDREDKAQGYYYTATIERREGA